MSGYVEKLSDPNQEGRGTPLGKILPDKILPIWRTQAKYDTEPKPAAIMVVGRENGYEVIFSNYTGSIDAPTKYPIKGKYAITGYHPQYGDVRIFPEPINDEAQYPLLNFYYSAGQQIITNDECFN